MKALNLGIILGSTRPDPAGEDVANWVYEIAKKRTEAELELVNIKDCNLPLLGESVPEALRQYYKPHVKAWTEKVGSFDGFVFVIPEFDYGLPSALKNAIDFPSCKWNNKAAGLVSYGGIGQARAVERLRLALAEVQIATVQNQVLLSLYADFECFTDFKPAPQHTKLVNGLFDQITAWGGVLKQLRDETESRKSIAQGDKKNRAPHRAKRNESKEFQL